MALDHAKFAAHALGVPLVLCPSILSVDAGYTVAAGVRDTRPVDGSTASKTSVVYVGDARPTTCQLRVSPKRTSFSRRTRAAGTKEGVRKSAIIDHETKLLRSAARFGRAATAMVLGYQQPS